MAGFILDTAPSATRASATTQRARTTVPLVDVETSDTNMSEEDTMTPESVPLPPPAPDAVSAAEEEWHREKKRLAVAIPMVTVSWIVLLAIVAMATFRISRWELAPGEAMAVSPRISFRAEKGESAPKRYPAEDGIRFVTAFGGQLSALDAVLGWIDPHVQVDTYTEHFGQQTPSTSRHVAFQSMFGAKQVAEYVAMTKLGLPAKFEEGLVIINELVCDKAPKPKSACKVLEIGDTIVKFNDTETPTLTDLVAAMKGFTAGQTVTLTVVPYGDEPDDKKARQERDVELMPNPDDAAKTIIGFVPADTRTVDLPFEVAITTTDIGGPSAGLAFTLALLDDLTPGDLMGKGRVAATGTMSPEGIVGAIGALQQKAVAVRDAGATLFLVPSGQSNDEIARARAAAGPGVRIVRVATLEEALAALRANGGDPLPSR